MILFYMNECLLQINKLAILGGDKLLEMSCIRKANELKVQKIERKKTRRNKVGYSMRFVITKVHQTEGTFSKKKNFVSTPGGGSVNATESREDPGN